MGYYKNVKQHIGYINARPRLAKAVGAFKAKTYFKILSYHGKLTALNCFVPCVAVIEGKNHIAINRKVLL